jgi:uncharacterized membrane protein YdbT with pleckstrin-like domain
MEYAHIWQKVLSSDEKIEYEFSISPLFLTFSFFIRLLVLLLLTPFIYTFSAKVALLFFLFIGLSLLFYYFFYLKEANAYAITNKRLIIHRGWLSTDSVYIDFAKITDITVIEPFFEWILTNSGDLHIDTAGTPSHEIILRHIASPYETRKKLEDIRTKAENSAAPAIDNPTVSD